MEGTCITCCFWKRFDANTGECHCKAPLPFNHNPKDQMINFETRWPLTNKEQSCGELKPIPAS